MVASTVGKQFRFQSAIMTHCYQNGPFWRAFFQFSFSIRYVEYIPFLISFWLLSYWLRTHRSYRSIHLRFWKVKLADDTLTSIGLSYRKWCISSLLGHIYNQIKEQLQSWSDRVCVPIDQKKEKNIKTKKDKLAQTTSDPSTIERINKSKCPTDKW